MTIADVLTDEVIERIVDRVGEAFPGDLDGTRAYNWSRIGPLIVEALRIERMPTYTFTVEVKAESAQKAGFRLRRLLQPNPAELFPDGVWVEPELSPDGVRQRWPEPNELEATRGG